MVFAPVGNITTPGFYVADNSVERRGSCLLYNFWTTKWCARKRLNSISSVRSLLKLFSPLSFSGHWIHTCVSCVVSPSICMKTSWFEIANTHMSTHTFPLTLFLYFRKPNFKRVYLNWKQSPTGFNRTCTGVICLGLKIKCGFKKSRPYCLQCGTIVFVGDLLCACQWLDFAVATTRCMAT